MASRRFNHEPRKVAVVIRNIATGKVSYRTRIDLSNKTDTRWLSAKIRRAFDSRQSVEVYNAAEDLP